MNTNTETETLWSADSDHGSDSDYTSVGGPRGGPGSIASSATGRVPRYVPPHARRTRLDMGDEVVVESRDPEKKDDQGSANKKYRRLLHRVNYALPKAPSDYLAAHFPGLFFVSAGHENHPHPVAHACSDVTYRFALRRQLRGACILDVNGNPQAAAAFNASQRGSDNPKNVRCLVNLHTPKDFGRALTKWGPRYTVKDTGEVDENYDMGRIVDMAPDYLRKFDTFLFHHSGYYHSMDDYLHIFRANEQAKIILNILGHKDAAGSLNNGEQVYSSRYNSRLQREIVEQTNVYDGDTYYHPNVFKEFWQPKSSQRQYCPPRSDLGFTWEMTEECEGHWSVHLRSFRKSLMDVAGLEDWDLAFAEALVEDTGVTVLKEVPPVTSLIDPDGRAIQLQVTNHELVTKLRLSASGQSRAGEDGVKLLKRLTDQARNLVDPGGMFPGQQPLTCSPELVVDHVISAFITDLYRETTVIKAARILDKVFVAHAKAFAGESMLATPGKWNFDIALHVIRQGAKALLAIAAAAAEPGSSARVLNAAQKLL